MLHVSIYLLLITPRVTRHDSLTKTTLQGTLEDWRRRGRGKAGWAKSKSGHPSPCQNCSRGPPAEKTGRWPRLNRFSSPPDDPIGYGTELNSPFFPFDYLLPSSSSHASTPTFTHSSLSLSSLVPPEAPCALSHRIIVVTGAREVPAEQQEPLLVRRPQEQATAALPPVLLRGGSGQVRNHRPVQANQIPP